MPSTYAHYRMGQEVRACVGEKERAIIEAYPELFLIGLHGPDILFYYKPLSKNAVNQTGYGMHKRPGREFFRAAGRIVRKQAGLSESDAVFVTQVSSKGCDREQTGGACGSALSYVYGFICHFALDAVCHGYIADKMAESGLSHAEIEVEFDRELMVMDGIDPIRHRLTGHIVPSGSNAAVIQTFFPGISTDQVQKALQGMITVDGLLLAPSRAKRFVIDLFFRLSGHYEGMHGLVVNYEKNPACADSTERLLALYREAKDLAVRLIEEYLSSIDGEKPFDPVYDYTFDSEQMTNAYSD